jgi:cyclopropane-fatty-acyl-phospholipid synthase
MTDIYSNKSSITEPRLTGIMAILVRILRRNQAGSLDLTLPNGSRVLIQGNQPGPDAVMHIRKARLIRRFLMGGHTAFGEAFVDGDWDSPDITAVLLYFTANEEIFDLEAGFLGRLALRLLHGLRNNSKRGSRKNIAFHYDLGNAFYERWLDRTMTYSSAVFEAPDQALDAAQRAKYKRIADQAGIEPGHRVLEIGCGWGGFAEYAASERGAHVTGITLSKEQHAYATQRLAKAGLAERTDIRIEDYRDVSGGFDRVVSIEMIEAVGEAYWPTYFEKIRALLNEGGRACLQAIVIEDRRFDSYRRHPDFIQRNIFPGGMLLSPSHLWDQVRKSGMNLVADDGFGHDYARTLALWRDSFLSAWPEIGTMGFDERFKRLWTYYLSYCEAGFRTGALDVRQVALSR